MDGLSVLVKKSQRKSRRELLEELNQASRETIGPEAKPCGECGTKLGLAVQRITEKYCVPCYKEIKFGLIPSPTNSRYGRRN